MKSVLKGFLVLLLILSFARLSFADSLINWRGFSIRGAGSSACYYNPNNPSSSNVSVTLFGDNASFIFSDLGIMLESSFDANAPRRQSSECHIEARLVMPRGYYLDSLKQTIMAAVFKTPGSKGLIHTDALMFHERIALTSLHVELEKGTEVEEPMAAWNQGHSFSYRDIYNQCLMTRDRDWYTVFKFKVKLEGKRDSHVENFMINFDSSDLTFELTPRLRSCRDVLRNPPRDPNPLPVPRPRPPRPTPIYDPTPVRPPSDEPLITPTPFGYRLIANASTHFLPDGGGLCKIRRGQAIFIKEEPKRNAYSQNVTLTRKIPNCRYTNLSMKGSIRVGEFRF